MSALEPDAPAPHIWPHWREAVRAWHAGRRGRHLGRAALGEARGKGPSTGDLLTVGRVFVQLGLIGTSGSLTRAGDQAVAVALGASPRSQAASGSTAGIEAIVKRLERALRRYGCVAQAKPMPTMRRWPTRHEDGEVREHAYLEENA